MATKNENGPHYTCRFCGNQLAKGPRCNRCGKDEDGNRLHYDDEYPEDDYYEGGDEQ